MSPKTTKRQRDAELARAAARRARRRPCRRCGRDTYFGLDASVMALDASTEVWSATPAEEVLAWSAGRWSYVLRGAGREVELDRRTRLNVITSPGRPHFGGRVVLEHVCGSPTRPEDEPDAVEVLDGPPPF